VAEVRVEFPSWDLLLNRAFVPLMADQSRYLVLKGGGGSGKSVFSAQKHVYRLLAEVPHKFLVVRKVKQDLRDSAYAEIINVIRTWGLDDLFKYSTARNAELYIRCLNGNEVIFYGLDDVERRKSLQGITGIWIEEASELTVEDFRQLDIRLRGETRHYKQIVLSFNPVSITHWLKTEFFDNPKPNARLSETTYKNNRFLDADSIRVLEGFKDRDPYHYTVYCLGEWGVLGKTIFDAQKVSERLLALRQREGPRRGCFAYEYEGERVQDDSIRWLGEENGYIAVYEEPKPGYPYVIGGDTAGEGSDWFTGQVIENTTGRQVAVLRHQFDEDLYAKQMYCLGRHYNDALLAVETNFSTYPVRELERLGYPHQYVRESEDTFTHRLKKSFGFHTTKLTRPVAISGLVEIVREHTDLLNDITTLEEMLTFVRNEHGKPEAQEGKFDDCVMALAIAYYARPQQTMALAARVFRLPDGVPEDVAEDYYNAPESERLRLLKKWGYI